MKKIIIATSGASGVNLGLKTLELLPKNIDKHFVFINAILGVLPAFKRVPSISKRNNN